MTELYTTDLDIWFEKGLDTPGITLLRVTPQECEFWEPSKGRIAISAGGASASPFRMSEGIHRLLPASNPAPSQNPDI